MVLVTGATGLVGSHLTLRLIENGENVRAIYRNSSAIQKTKSVFELYNKAFLFEKIDWIQADIIDVPSLTVAFQDIDYVYHCAALISFDPKDEKPLRKTNIEGTANMVNLCLAFNVKKLCHVSSIAALGDLATNETIITEKTEWNPEKPHSDYAISKYGAEMEIWRGQQEGLQVVIVCPGIILGSGFWDSGSGILFSKVKKGILFYTKGSTGFVSVNDVVKIMMKLMKSEIVGERFIAIAKIFTFENILQIIAKALQVKPPTFYAKPWHTELGWKVDWIASNFFLRKRTLSKSMARALHSTDVISNEKIKIALDYEFQDIEEYCAEISPSLKF